MVSKRILIFYFVFCAATVTGLFSQEKSVDPVADLAPEEQHGRVGQEVANALRFYHYKEPAIDDSLSAHFFDAYLDLLDPQKVYFLQSDIDGFAAKRLQLDDALKSGDVQFAYDVFNLLRKRMLGRISFVLGTDLKAFDYSRDEYFEYDREHAPYFASPAEQDEYWRKRIKYEALNLKLAGKESEKSEETIEKRYKNLNDAMRKQNSEDVFQLYMNALTEVVDPHSSYFSPRTAESFKINMSNSLEGIGATLSSEGEYTKIVELVKGGPADKSRQLMKNDKIVAVGQGEGEMEDILGWRIDDVVSKIRGAKGTVVRLEIMPANAADGRTKIVSLVREKVKLEEQSAKGEVHILGKTRIGVIRVPSFYFDFEAYQRGEKDYKSTTGDVARILDDFRKQKVKGVVMDLRGNGGGSLIEAVELTGLFIDRGPVVQVRDAEGQTDIKFDEAGIRWEGPLLVMIDRFSASASEIFAGAIQDYGRGIIAGSQSYGKGTVQNLMDLNRLLPREQLKLGQLKLTLAKFYRITGSSTQHRGVMPDIEFPSAFPAEEYGESSEKYALPWDQIRGVVFTGNPAIKAAVPQLQKLHDSRMAGNLRYKYLLEDIDEFRRRKAETRVSLNEEILKKERDAEKEKEKAREEALKTVPAAKTGRDEKDFLLDEACQILKDMMMLSR